MKKIQISIFTLLIILIFSQNCVSQADFNKLDENGKKQGLWKGFYAESKRPRYEGIFDHGKEIGFFTFYDDTKAKAIIATREFNPKDNAAFTIFFDQNKNKVSEGKVLNKLFEGQWKYFHEASKIIMTLENYSLGQLEGIRTVFYIDGKIAEEMNYKNNLKNGFYKKYTAKGVLLEESNFKNDVYNGMAIFKDSNGDMASKGEFVNGKKAGIWQFFEKGKLIKETNMNFQEKAAKTKNN